MWVIALDSEIVGRDGELAHGRAPTARLTHTEQRIADAVFFEELGVRRAELAARSPARAS